MIPTTCPRHLPFATLAPQQMEDLTREVMQAVDGIDRIRTYGRSGQDQGGLDLFGWRREEFHVYQVRRIASLSDTELRTAVTDFAIFPGAGTKDGRRMEATRFVLVTACVAADTKVEDELLALRAKYKGDIEIDLYDGETLSDKLRHHPRITEAYFGNEWAKAFCAERLSSEPEGTPTWRGLLDGPIHDLGLEGLLHEANERLATDPGAAAKTFAIVADRLAKLYPGHAATIRHRQFEALKASGQHQAAFNLGCEIVLGEYEGGGHLYHHPELKKLTKHLGTAERAIYKVIESIEGWLRGPGFDLGEAVEALKSFVGSSYSGGDSLLLAIAELVLVDEDPADDVNLIIPLLETAIERPGYGAARTRLRAVLADLKIRGGKGAVKDLYESLENDARSGYLSEGLTGLSFMRKGRAHAFRGELREAIGCYRAAVIQTSHARLNGDTRESLLAIRYLESLGGVFDEQLSSALQALKGRETLVDNGSTADSKATERLLKGDHTEALTASKRATWKARVSGALVAEFECRKSLGQAWNQPGLQSAALRQMLLAGDRDGARKLSAGLAQFVDITEFVSSPALWIQAAAATALETQANLIPDDKVAALCPNLLSLALSHCPSPFQPSPDLDGHSALAALAARLPTFVAEVLLHRFQDLIPRPPNTYKLIDSQMLRILSGIASSHAFLRERALHMLVECLEQSIDGAWETLGELDFAPAALTPRMLTLAQGGSIPARRVLSAWGVPSEETWKECVRMAEVVFKEPIGQKRMQYGFGSLIPQLCVTLMSPLPKRRPNTTEPGKTELQRKIAARLLDWVEDRFDTATRRADAALGFTILSEALPKSIRKPAFQRLLSVYDSPGEHNLDTFEKGSQHPLSRFKVDLGGSRFRYEVLHCALSCACSTAQFIEIERRLLPELRRIEAADSSIQLTVAWMLVKLNKHRPLSLSLLVTHPSLEIRLAGLQCWQEKGCKDAGLLAILLEDSDLRVISGLAQQIDNIALTHPHLEKALRQRFSEHPDYRIRQIMRNKS